MRLCQSSSSTRTALSASVLLTLPHMVFYQHFPMLCHWKDDHLYETSTGWGAPESLEDPLSLGDLLCQRIECSGDVLGLIECGEGRFHLSRERQGNLVPNAVPFPMVPGHQARDRSERVWVISNDPEGVPLNQHGHDPLFRQAGQVGKQQRPATPGNRCPPIWSVPSPLTLVLGEQGDPALSEIFDGLHPIRSPLSMPRAPRRKREACCRSPQGLRPGCEQVVGLRPAVAFEHVDPIADVLTAFYLGRTHPFAFQAAGKMLHVKYRARSFYVNAPGARAQCIIGPSIWRVLQSASTESGSQTCLQIPGEVGVFVQITLAQLSQSQRARPGQGSPGLSHRAHDLLFSEQGVQALRRGMGPGGRAVAGEIAEHLMGEESRRVEDRPCQGLFQVGYGGQQAGGIGEHPGPSRVLREEEAQTPCFLLAALLWPQEDAGGARLLRGVRMGDDHPVLARLLEAGTGGALREGSARHDPEGADPCLPEEGEQSVQFPEVGRHED